MAVYVIVDVNVGLHVFVGVAVIVKVPVLTGVLVKVIVPVFVADEIKVCVIVNEGVLVNCGVIVMVEVGELKIYVPVAKGVSVLVGVLDIHGATVAVGNPGKIMGVWLGEDGKIFISAAFCIAPTGKLGNPLK